jgi:hypothetical protein
MYYASWRPELARRTAVKTRPTPGFLCTLPREGKSTDTPAITNIVLNACQPGNKHILLSNALSKNSGYAGMNCQVITMKNDITAGRPETAGYPPFMKPFKTLLISIARIAWRN